MEALALKAPISEAISKRLLESDLLVAVHIKPGESDNSGNGVPENWKKAVGAEPQEIFKTLGYGKRKEINGWSFKKQKAIR